MISIDALDGIRPAIEHTVTLAMTTCTNGERLAVCLYFMSELPDRWHHLSDIEKNLRRIFPPSSHGHSPGEYEDFQATAIRAYFNHEQRLTLSDPLWENVNRGYWRNTEFGNRYARGILRRQGLSIELRGTIVNDCADDRRTELS
jgi:hypothetical protein